MAVIRAAARRRRFGVGRKAQIVNGGNVAEALGQTLDLDSHP
ncbi:MAG: hypothetical protein ACXWDJ_08120 [Aeromicrobium sp.]